MAIDTKRARRVLRAAGVRASALPSSWWPIGRERRLLALARQRRAVLEAKNNVVDFLVRAQRALSHLKLRSVQDVEAALRDPEEKPRILAVSANREVLAEELRSRYGVESGRALEDALSELVREGVVLRVPAKVGLSRQDIYFITYGRERAHYEVADLTSVLHEGGGYGARLRSRSRRDASSGGGRTYDM